MWRRVRDSVFCQYLQASVATTARFFVYWRRLYKQKFSRSSSRGLGNYIMNGKKEFACWLFLYTERRFNFVAAIMIPSMRAPHGSPVSYPGAFKRNTLKETWEGFMLAQRARTQASPRSSRLSRRQIDYTWAWSVFIRPAISFPPVYERKVRLLEVRTPVVTRLWGLCLGTRRNFTLAILFS